jgi:hypothetical protein
MDGDIQISENKLEEFIYQYLTLDKNFAGFYELHDPDCLIDIDYVYRQFNLGSYGIPDIVSFEIEPDGLITTKVYELKKGPINKDTLVQVLKYKKGFETIFNDLGFEDYRISCKMVGCRLSESNGFSVAVSSIECVDSYTYDIDPSIGITITKKSLIFTNTNLPKESKNKLTCMSYMSSDNECTFDTDTIPF